MHTPKLAIITGATGAIGASIAENIAKNHDNRVVLFSRNEQKAIRTIQEIEKKTSNQKLDYCLVDMAEPKDIFRLANHWDQPIDILINNAATTPGNRMENKNGIELQFATNVLGYFCMMTAFHPFLKKASPSRIINVASYWAGDLDMDDLEFSKRHYNNNMAYRQSKQANRMLTVAIAERFRKFGITVNSCHPGDVNSKLSNDLGFGGSQEADSGAKTPVWLATDDFPQNITGSYFERNSEAKCSFSNDKQAIETLYSICQSY